jgi:hypothetical protein
LAEAGAVFVGGFHSRLERLCLDQLTVAGCWRSFVSGERSRDSEFPWLAAAYAEEAGSGFSPDSSQKRATRDSVRVRNECTLALADTFVIPHATVAGKTEALCRDVLKAGKAVWTLNQPGSRNLLALGAKLATAGKVDEILNSGRKGLASSQARD